MAPRGMTKNPIDDMSTLVRVMTCSSSSKFYSQQNTTMEQYQEKENTL